jgi:hypothetical protein
VRNWGFGTLVGIVRKALAVSMVLSTITVLGHGKPALACHDQKPEVLIVAPPAGPVGTLVEVAGGAAPENCPLAPMTPTTFYIPEDAKLYITDLSSRDLGTLPIPVVEAYGVWEAGCGGRGQTSIALEDSSVEALPGGFGIIGRGVIPARVQPGIYRICAEAYPVGGDGGSPPSGEFTVV